MDEAADVVAVVEPVLTEDVVVPVTLAEVEVVVADPGRH